MNMVGTKRVLLRGPFLSQSGYGVHARQIARWLYDLADTTADTDIEVFAELYNWGMTPWVVDHAAAGGLVRRLWQSKVPVGKAPEVPYDMTIQVQLPNEWNPDLGQFNVGVTAAVETSWCNPEWVTACNRMDLVVVPSTFTKKVLESSGVLTTKVVVIPESFYDELLPETFDRVDPLILPGVETKTNLLLFGQVTGTNPDNDRKNLFYTIKWLGECLAGRPDVGVVIKTNSGRLTKADRVLTSRILSQVYTETCRGSGPKVHLLHGDMSNLEMVALLKSPQITGMVSATRGEAYGLPTLEAAVAGVPILATGWSGHLDFLPPKKWVSFEFDLKNIHDSRVDNQIFMKGSQWAEVREGDFRKKILRFVDNVSIPKGWGQETRQKLLKTHSHAEISKIYTLEVGQHLLKRPQEEK